MLIRRLTMLICVLVFLVPAFCVFAGGPDEQVRVLVDGEEISFHVAPQLYNERLIVPARPLLEALGAPVDWDREKEAVSTVWDGHTIIFHINRRMVEVNGETITTDAPAVVVGGATMIPLRAVSDLFGLHVQWDGKNNVVEVKSCDYVPFQRLNRTPPADLPPHIRQWVEAALLEKTNDTMELAGNLYILSTLGRKPTGGYEVKIGKIVREPSAWRVKVEVWEPLPGQGTIQVISHPYDLVRLDLELTGKPAEIFFDCQKAIR